MAWVQVRDLGAISPASKVNLAPRDRAQIAYLGPSHLKALQASGGRKARFGDVQNARDGWVATISARMALFGVWEFQARFGARSREGFATVAEWHDIRKSWRTVKATPISLPGT